MTKKLLALIVVFMLVVQAMHGGVVFEVGASAAERRTVSPFTGRTYIHHDMHRNAEIIHGLDVSQWQRNVNWSRLREQGITWVIIRAGARGYGARGTLIRDTHFRTHMQGAIAAGLDIGVYFYSQALNTTEAFEEVDIMIEMAREFQSHITLPLVFDFEYASVGAGGLGGRLFNARLSRRTQTNICLAAMRRIEAAGFTAMLYANQDMLTRGLYPAEIAAEFDIWLANYGARNAATVRPAMNGVLFPHHYSFWQYADWGRVTGIAGGVDVNFRYFTRPAAVRNLRVSSVTDGYTILNWSRIPGVFGYQVQRFNPQTGTYQHAATLQGAARTRFVDRSEAGQNGGSRYRVRAISYNNNAIVGGAFSGSVTAETLFRITPVHSRLRSIQLSWTPVQGIAGYEVLRANSARGPFAVVGRTNANTTRFTDRPQNPFRKFYYQIRPYTLNEQGQRVPGRASAALGIERNQPRLVDVALNTNTSARVRWRNVNGAAGVRIYRRAEGQANFRRIRTIRDNTTTSFIDRDLRRGRRYTYRVRNFFVNEGGTTFSSNNTVARSVRPLTTPNARLEARNRAVVIRYNRVQGANGYQVQMRAPGGSWRTVRTTRARVVTQRNLTRGRRYEFRVRAFRNVGNRRVNSTFSEVRSAVPR